MLDSYPEEPPSPLARRTCRRCRVLSGTQDRCCPAVDIPSLTSAAPDGDGDTEGVLLVLRSSSPFSSPTPPHRHRLHVFSFYTSPRAAHRTHLQLSNKYAGSSPEKIRATTRVLYLQCLRRGLIVKLGTSKCNSVCY